MVWGIRAVFRPTGRLVISLCSLWIYEQQISSCLMDDGRQPNVALHDACLIILYRLTWSTYIDSLSFPHDIHSWLCTRRPLRTTSPSGHDSGGFFRRALDVGRCCGGSRAEANVLLAKSDIQSYGQLWHRAKGIDLPIDWNNKQSSMMYCNVYVLAFHITICFSFLKSRLAKASFRWFIVLPAVKIDPSLLWKRYKSSKWLTLNLDWTAWKKYSCYRYDNMSSPLSLASI